MFNNENDKPIPVNELKIFDNENYSQWIELKNNYPRFRNYRENKKESGYEEIYRLRSGFYIRILNLKIHQKSVVELSFAGRHLHVCFKIKGKHSLRSSSSKEMLLNASTAALYYFENNEKLIDTCNNDDYLMIMLVIDLDIISNEVLGYPIDSLPEMLREIINSQNKNSKSKSVQSINNQNNSLEFSYDFGIDIYSAATALVERKVNNEHLRIYLECKAIELLCLLFQDLCLLEANIRLKNLAPSDVKVLKLVKEKIDSCIQEVPSIPILAKKFNITESRLKTGFKSLFGLPVRAYVHGLRMQQAQEMLMQGQLNIDLIAIQLGYNYTSNFISAFKQNFGMTPKSYQNHLLSFASEK